MKNHALDLLLLTTTLSQLNSKEMIIRLFIESMNNIFQTESFQWHSERNSEDKLVLDVCTRNKNYGYLSYSVASISDPNTIKLIHNSIQILAILLEKTEQENNLQNLVDQRTIELSRVNENLEHANQDLQEQIHAHKGTLETLRKSEEKYKSLIDKVQTAIILHDNQGKIIESNPLANELLGITRNAIIGKSLLDKEWHFLREDGSIMPVSEYPATKVLTEKKIVRNYIVGIRQHVKDKILWVLVNAEPEYNDSGDIMQVIVSFIDISERIKMNGLYRQAQKMDAIGQLAGGVAHDFNNMLGGIIAAAQILKNPKRNLDEKGLKFVDLILDASKQAAELTNKLLSFGRKSEITSTKIGIHTVIDETVALLHRTIDKRIKIFVTENAEQSTVTGDGTTLQNAILNLGINASQAMPDGGELHITTRNVFLDKEYCLSSPHNISEGNYIEIEVRDTGMGIPPENINKIFEPFFTTKEQGKGTGLGLATVYATVQNHHGSIDIFSNVGSGTVFSLFLPCSGKSPEPVKHEETIFSGKGLILLVDDEELIRLTEKETLEDMGFSILLAENGEEAVDIFKKNHSEIDLVIMDMVMPVMNGSDAFLKMREIDENCNVMISSGNINKEKLDDLKKAGLAGFIPKPFRDYELSRIVNEAINSDNKK